MAIENFLEKKKSFLFTKATATTERAATASASRLTSIRRQQRNAVSIPMVIPLRKSHN